MIAIEQMVSGDKMIIPYVEVNGMRTIPDNIVAAFYSELIKQGVLPKLFRQSNVNNIDDFLTVFKSPVNIGVFACQNEKIVGMAWLNDLRDNHAFAHFGFLKQAWGQAAIDFGKMILNYWFSFPKDEKRHLFDVICGNTPSDNRSAIAFVAKMGFTVIGEIPMIYRHDNDKFSGATISYLTRETFYG